MPSSHLPAAVERALGPLDALRGAFLVRAAGLPGIGPSLARRDARIGIVSALGVALLFALTIVAPGALYVLGPALLGVAHVASDARYLVLRRSLSRPFLALLLLGGSSLFLARLLALVRGGDASSVLAEVAIGFGLPLLGACFGCAAGGSWRPLLVLLPPLGFLLLEALRTPALAQLCFAHAHNVIALSLWIFLFRRRFLTSVPTLLLLALGTVLFLTGVTASWSSPESPWDKRFLAEMTSYPVLGLAPRWLLGLGLSFVFLQAAHYSAWLAWIPQEDLRTEGTTTFRMSVRSLLQDFRPWGLGLVTLAVASVIALSFVSLHRTRHVYLSLATFHGYLELTLFTYFLARGPWRLGVLSQ